MMIVPFYSTEDMPTSLKRDFIKVIQRTLESDNLIEGRACRNFEEQFGKYLGGVSTIGVGNGYDALYILLIALSLPKKSRIAVPIHTFSATWLSIINAGHEPIGFDIDEFGNLDPNSLPEDSSDSIRVLIAVHMHGNPAQIHRISDWCLRNDVILIEDCAQAAGLRVSGQHVGSFGIAGIFSFYPTKNLFALGDGGAIVTRDPNLASQVRQISRYGMPNSDKLNPRLPAVNSRLDSIQAAVLTVGLSHLDQWNHTRQSIAARYSNFLAHKLETNGVLGAQSIYHHYTIKVENRSNLQNQLKVMGVNTAIHYQYLANEGIAKPTFPVYKALDYVRKILSLPMSPWQTSKATNFVSQCVLKILHGLS